MRIEHLSLRNFKRFGQLKVDLRPSNCLVGANNSGKTTLLQALALFDFCKSHCLSATNGRLELKSRSVEAEGLYVLPVPNPRDLWTDRKAMEKGKQKRIGIGLRFDAGLEVTASVRLSYNRFGLGLETTDKSQEALQRLRDFSMAYLPVFSAFLPQEERRTRVAVDDDLARGRVNVVVRNMLVNLRDEGRDGQLVQILRRLFPELRRLDIQFDEASDRFISVEYKEKGRPKAFDLFSAGSGFQQFLYLFGFIILRQPSVVLLDEPDVHLHGSLQRALVEELDRLVADGKQVLFATHSRDLIERVDPRDVIFLDGNEAKPLSVEHDVYDTLDSLGSLDASQLPALQRYRRVLIVENKTDYELLAQFCEHCLGPEIWRNMERRLAVCFAAGNPYKQDIPLLRKQLSQALALTGAPLKAFVLADRDYYPDREQLMLSLRAKNLDWHVWKRTEIENYLLVVDAVIRLLGGGQDQRVLWEPELTREFERLIEESRREVRHRLVASHQEQSRRLRKGSDPSKVSRQAERYLEERWTSDKLGLADAKDFVLPELKRWCRTNGLESFSNRKLAESLRADELPEEVHAVARRLADFAGVSAGSSRSRPARAAAS